MHCIRSTSKKIIPLIFLPWCISEVVSYFALLSYLIAWLGSFYLFYLSIYSPSGTSAPTFPPGNR